jgi:hypothetical protein
MSKLREARAPRFASILTSGTTEVRERCYALPYPVSGRTMAVHVEEVA